MSRNSRPEERELKRRVHAALQEWPEPEARRELLGLCANGGPETVDVVAYALVHAGHLRDQARSFLDHYHADRRLALRRVQLFAALHDFRDEPREFLRELRRIVSLPGSKPWPEVMVVLRRMWARHPREMFRFMPGWLTHRDPWRRWAALHGLEIPARKDPRSALKVLRLLRGEKNPRVRRMLGHVLGQGFYPRHPEAALEEMARWLGEGAASAKPVTRQAEYQVALWFDDGYGTERQLRRLRRVAMRYEEHRSAAVRAHARRLVRLLSD